MSHATITVTRDSTNVRYQVTHRDTSGSLEALERFAFTLHVDQHDTSQPREVAGRYAVALLQAHWPPAAVRVFREAFVTICRR